MSNSKEAPVGWMDGYETRDLRSLNQHISIYLSLVASFKFFIVIFFLVVKAFGFGCYYTVSTFACRRDSNFDRSVQITTSLIGVCSVSASYIRTEIVMIDDNSVHHHSTHLAPLIPLVASWNLYLAGCFELRNIQRTYIGESMGRLMVVISAECLV